MLFLEAFASGGFVEALLLLEPFASGGSVEALLLLSFASFKLCFF